ncbi:hypothetical protein SOV_08540 [Sporomusa ovata DSM 2662]|uniref:Uncharacterized protein n=1 Tax=Sporomusa ovata TaxID=2378 RepID=A0A0U1L557_9FIRM|nr:hypothetical protein [Sporomusa ovata]EQB28503.1 hypothetical protein SOV_1c01920 [Sporomusa ovata DSM 2662]CQR74832.1 hypothetical protein SpAn4DRAFT_4189 [Sporomusa ovata]
MWNLIEKLFNCKQVDSNADTVKADIPVDSQDKKVLIPVALDITRTQEFWDKAVPS